MFNQKEKYRMRRTMILAVVASLLSFGMIDSAITKQIENDKATTSWEKMVEEEKLRKEAEELRIEQYHKDELLRFLNDIVHR